MKLFLASLGVGIVVPGFVLIGLVFAKVLFPESNPFITVLVLNLFCWPIAVVKYFPSLTVEAMILVSFFLGTVLNVTLLTAVTYFFFKLTLAKRLRARTVAPAPPLPPSF